LKVRITIDIFSGRNNPVIELAGNDARDAIDRLRPDKKIEKGDMGLPPAPTLGYRGLIIEQIEEPVKDLPDNFRFVHGDIFGTNLAQHAIDATFEEYVCGKEGLVTRIGLGTEFSVFVKKEIQRYRLIRTRWPWKGRIIWPPKNPCRCAPLYEPAWWNDGGQKQRFNNCYNYGTNYRSDTYAQPGRAAGSMYSDIDCALVKAAAVKDALIDSPDANNKCPPKGHLVALVIAPSPDPNARDFHWYRKGRNGYWSHKPGGWPVTNVDNSGTTIRDPRQADRGMYTNFCTFMVVMHGHIKIQ